MLRKSVAVGCFLSLLAIAAAQTHLPGTNQSIRDIILEGVTAIPAAEQQRIVEGVLNQIRAGIHDNGKSYIDQIAERIRFEFQNRGYFKVLVDDPFIKVVANNSGQEIVDLVISLDEGDQYRLKDIGFVGEVAFSAAELRATFPIANGEIFNRTKVASGLDNLRELYCKKGYLNFSAVPEQEIDEQAHTISLTIDLDGGSVFRLGKLIVEGQESEPHAREKLLNTWKSYEGRTYDCSILKRFLRDLHARPSLKPEQVFEIAPDSQARLVNVQITLVKPVF